MKALDSFTLAKYKVVNEESHAIIYKCAIINLCPINIQILAVIVYKMKVKQ